MIKVLIADDHKIFRKGLKQALEDFPEIQVTGEASNGNEVLSKVSKAHYDVIILDITMPGPSGVEIMKQLKSDNPSIPVLFLSMHPEEQYALRVIKAGASGYLTKDAEEEQIVQAIRKVYRGGKFITPTLAEQLAFALDVDFEKPPHELLSDREYQVMLMMATGKTISEIADEIHLGVSTVSTYRSRILEKAGLKNSAEIIQYAYKNHLID